MKIKQPLHLKSRRNYEPEPPKILNVETQKSINVETKIFESELEAAEYLSILRPTRVWTLWTKRQWDQDQTKIIYPKKVWSNL